MTLPLLGVIAREGIETVDGRILAHGSLEWDEPIPLLDLPTRDPLGDLTRVTRDDDGTIRAEGVTTLPPGTYPVGVEVDSCRYDHPHGTDTVTFTAARIRRLVVYLDRRSDPAWPDARITVADPALLSFGIVRDPTLDKPDVVQHVDGLIGYRGLAGSRPNPVARRTEPKAPRRPLRCRLGWHQRVPTVTPLPGGPGYRVALSCSRCPWTYDLDVPRGGYPSGDQPIRTDRPPRGPAPGAQFQDAPADPPPPPRGPAAVTPVDAQPPFTATPDATTGRRPMPQLHLLGRPVWFRSRTGRWTAPAIVTATTRSLYQPNVEAGHLRPLSSPTHVHLTVLTPGLPGHVSDETRETHPELVDPNRPNPPAGGSFQEFDVEQWEPDGPFEFEDQPPGTWTWPL